MPPDVETQSFSRRKLENFLDALERRPSLEALTLTLGPGASLNSLELRDPQQRRWLDEVRILAADRIVASETGSVVFWSDLVKLTVIPPIPLNQDSHVAQVDTGPLRQLLRKEYTVGVVLLRLGRYSVGVFKGDRLLTSKTDTRYVKGRHRAGGTSQLRFQRIREKQIHEIFIKTCLMVSERFKPFEDTIDYIFFGGERHTLMNFLKKCPYLQRMESRILKRILPTAEPGLRELERMPHEIWKSQVAIYHGLERTHCQGLGND